MLLNDKEEILTFTRHNPYDRFPDGRPKVPDDILERMKKVTVEEAWGVLQGHGYRYQFEGDWVNLHPDLVLVGRAVTATFVPVRPDVEEIIVGWGKERNCTGGQNSWVIDTLVENDVIVVDLFGKVKGGTFAGDNLGTAIAAKTKTGMIIDGGIRDLARLYEIPNFATFVRGIDPSAISDVTLVGLNRPTRIGNATVLPGDVVLGNRSGVIFIPPEFAKEVVEQSEEIRLRDRWGHQRLREGKYLPGQVDGGWTEEMQADYKEWRKTQEP